MDISGDPPKTNLFRSLLFRKTSLIPNKNQPLHSTLTTHQETGLKNLTTTTHHPSLTCINHNIVSFLPPFVYKEERKAACEKGKKVCESSVKNQRRSTAKREKEYPPPIRSLVKTGEFPYHMPYELKRSYEEDGHLVIHEVKVKHHEFFRTHRANGRLVLKLVHLDENYPEERGEEDDQIEKEEEGGEESERDNEEEIVTEGLRIGEKSKVSDMISASPMPESLLGGMGNYEGEENEEKGGCGTDKNNGIVTDGSRVEEDYDVSEMILASSMPEFSSGALGNNGALFFGNRKFANTSLFSTPILTFRPLRS